MARRSRKRAPRARKAARGQKRAHRVARRGDAAARKGPGPGAAEAGREEGTLPFSFTTAPPPPPPARSFANRTVARRAPRGQLATLLLSARRIHGRPLTTATSAANWGEPIPVMGSQPTAAWKPCVPQPGLLPDVTSVKAAEFL